ncbi:hypothetical protein OG563_26055 [Nocardia vinacea]|uniref:Uncharacterized protein n=1 Tax=Nocardia vinacea TaxID=96468 RepID=A0ABZ1YHK4_9NOCA|nr:hypothetical protein [Nocardia vinacea]
MFNGILQRLALREAVHRELPHDISPLVMSPECSAELTWVRNGGAESPSAHAGDGDDAALAAGQARSFHILSRAARSK